MRWSVLGSQLRVAVLTLLVSSCAKEDLLNPPPASPVVVRGWYSYTLSIDGDNSTIELRDSVYWYPYIAYLSVAVSNYSSGTGILEITDSSGMRISLDSLNRTVENLNRKITPSMPLHLHLTLQGFTGAVACGLQLGPAEINGMPAHLALRDSLGSERTMLRGGELFSLSYSVINLSGNTQHWATGDGRPLVRFRIDRGDSTVGDSFDGLAWTAAPRQGDLPAGDSIRVTWNAVSPEKALPPGHYVASAEPQFVLTTLGFLANLEYPFDIGP